MAPGRQRQGSEAEGGNGYPPQSVCVCVCVFRGGVGRRGQQRVSCHAGILVTLVSINEKGTELLAAPVHPYPLPQEACRSPRVVRVRVGEWKCA